jgi:hypothetical protein
MEGEILLLRNLPDLLPGGYDGATDQEIDLYRENESDTE